MPEKFWLDLPPKMSFRGLTPNEKAKLEARFEYLLSCRRVTVHDDPMNGRKGWIIVYRNSEPPAPDYPSDDEMGPWPGLPNYPDDMGPWPGFPGKSDFSQPIPLGVAHRTHSLVGLTMVTEDGSKNMLVFGFPGSGKSVAASQIIAAGALDPTVNLWGADGGGGTDLEFWRRRMSHYEVLPEKVFLMLRELDKEVQHRGLAMAAEGRRKIDPHDPKILLVMEEFATFTDDKTRRSFADGFPTTPKEPGEKMADLVTRIGRLGRKYGISILAITQSPTVDTIPGKFRRLMQLRWGLRTPDPQGWRAGMGPGIPFVKLEKPGDGVLLDETGHGARLKSFYLTDTDLETIADSVAPVVPPKDAKPTETYVNPAAPALAPTAAPPVAPEIRFRLNARDLSVLDIARDPVPGPLLIERVGWSPGYGRKRLSKLVVEGLLSWEQKSVTAPKIYVTTLRGRAEIPTGELGNIPDGAPGDQASDSELPEEPVEQGGAR